MRRKRLLVSVVGEEVRQSGERLGVVVSVLLVVSDVTIIWHQSRVAVNGLRHEGHNDNRLQAVSVVGVMLVWVTHVCLVGVVVFRVVMPGMMVFMVLMSVVVMRMHRIGKWFVLTGMVVLGLLVTRMVVRMVLMAGVMVLVAGAGYRQTIDWIVTCVMLVFVSVSRVMSCMASFMVVRWMMGLMMSVVMG